MYKRNTPYIKSYQSLFFYILFLTTQTLFSQSLATQQSVDTQQKIVTKTPSAKQVFLYHKEMFDIIDDETSFRPSLVACTSKVNGFHNSLFDVASYNVVTDKLIEEYRYSIPYTNDACVIASRKSDSFENVSDVLYLNYTSIQASVIINDWLKQLGADFDITESQQKSLQTCLERIYRGDFDYTILPQRLLQGALEASSLAKEIHLSRPLFYCEYRMAIPKDDYLTLITVNDTLTKYQQNGVFQKLAKKYNVDEYKVNNTYLSQIIFNYIVIACISVFLTFLILLIITRKIRTSNKKILDNRVVALQHQLIQAREQETILLNDIENLTKQVTKSDTALREALITEQYTNLFRKDYILSQIKREIQTFNLSSRPFTVASLVIQDASVFDRETVKHISNIILSNSGDFAQCCYNGFGVFYILFPRQKAADVRVITDTLLELLTVKNTSENTSTKSIYVVQVLEYDGQGFDQFVSFLQDK